MKRLWLCLLLFNIGCVSSSNSLSGRTTQQGNAENFNGARIHTELGANYYSRHQYAIALEELGNALKSFPAYGPAFNMLGLVYMELKEDSKAIQSFEQALKIDPNDPEANNNYGWFICQRGDPAKSMSYFAAAQRNSLYSTPELSLANAGICARKMNDTVNAEKYFTQALALQPNQGKALYNLADLSFDRGDFERSRAYLTRYMRVENPTAEALWLALRTERRLADRGAEASYAAQLCRRFPDSLECQAVKAGSER